MSALVSVIIPIYNIEKYIANCLNSIVNQTYTDIEIVCVDDGSKDGSADIVKSFAQKDERIVYVYQKNSGLAAARNTGIKNSSGDYLIFVDGDDYLHLSAVALLAESCEKGGFDFVTSLLYQTPSLDTSFEITSDCVAEKIGCSEYLTRCNDCSVQSSCGKIYKREIFDDLMFDETLKVSEDMDFIFSLLQKKYSMGFLNNYLYYYYKRDNSLSRRPFSTDFFDTVKVLENYSDLFFKEKNNCLFSYTVDLLASYACLNRMKAYRTPHYKQTCSDCRKIRKKWTLNVVKTKEISYKNKLKWFLLFSRRIYDMVRYLMDPSMKDYFKNRGKQADIDSVTGR